jgi:hypothetical protein
MPSNLAIAMTQWKNARSGPCGGSSPERDHGGSDFLAMPAVSAGKQVPSICLQPHGGAARPPPADTSNTSTPAAGACLHMFAVPRPPGNVFLRPASEHFESAPPHDRAFPTLPERLRLVLGAIRPSGGSAPGAAPRIITDTCTGSRPSSAPARSSQSSKVRPPQTRTRNQQPSEPAGGNDSAHSWRPSFDRWLEPSVS